MFAAAGTRSRCTILLYNPSMRFALLSVRCAQTRYRTEAGTPSQSSFRIFLFLRACDAGTVDIIVIHLSSRWRCASTSCGSCVGGAGSVGGAGNDSGLTGVEGCLELTPEIIENAGLSARRLAMSGRTGLGSGDPKVSSWMEARC